MALLKYEFTEAMAEWYTWAKRGHSTGIVQRDVSWRVGAECEMRETKLKTLNKHKRFLSYYLHGDGDAKNRDSGHYKS